MQACSTWCCTHRTHLADRVTFTSPAREIHGTGSILNIGTILTGDSDAWDPNGKWQYASVQADATIQRALATATRASLDTGAMTTTVLLVGALGAIGLLTGIAGLRLLRLRRKLA